MNSRENRSGAEDVAELVAGQQVVAVGPAWVGGRLLVALAAAMVLEHHVRAAIFGAVVGATGIWLGSCTLCPLSIVALLARWLRGRQRIRA